MPFSPEDVDRFCEGLTEFVMKNLEAKYFVTGGFCDIDLFVGPIP